MSKEEYGCICGSCGGMITSTWRELTISLKEYLFGIRQPPEVLRRKCYCKWGVTKR